MSPLPNVSADMLSLGLFGPNFSRPVLPKNQMFYVDVRLKAISLRPELSRQYSIQALWRQNLTLLFAVALGRGRLYAFMAFYLSFRSGPMTNLQPGLENVV